MFFLLIFVGLVFIGLIIFLVGNQILIQKYYWGPEGQQGRFKEKKPRVPKGESQE